MKNKIEELKVEALEKINSANDIKDLEDIKVFYFGKKGVITAFMQNFKNFSNEEKKELGILINAARSSIENSIQSKYDKFNSEKLKLKMIEEAIDVSLPPKQKKLGHLHPCTLIFNEVKNIFSKLGYHVVEGPEIEYDEYNFEKLNIEKGHPARDEQDTFYINDKVLLRTQTSPVQARILENKKFPICILTGGRVFRSDSVDATHSPTFHQIEGLVVDKNISFTDLKGTLDAFAKALYGKDIKTRFRPHHFPFTEPSAEMDVSCFRCGGKGCRFCKNEGWIEILGCGMVNPKVYNLCGINDEDIQGFAFGIGIERLALFKYEIDDMRLLYENDIRFLNQF